jgi:hypothetical protein
VVERLDERGIDARLLLAPAPIRGQNPLDRVELSGGRCVLVLRAEPKLL